MKALPLVIAASLAANAALVAFVLTRSADSTTRGAAAASATPALSPKTSALTSSPASSATSNPKLWSDLNSTSADLPALIARLRAAGFPASVIRAIVTAQVREDFAAKRRALNPTKADLPFWKNDQPTDPKLRLALRDLNREQEAVLTRLLGGPDPDRALFMGIYERRQYGDLPADKVSQLSTVKRDYDEMRSDIYEASRGGTMLPEDRAKLALLDKEQRADFAQVLTPQELADYDLRSSNTANQMRYNLTAFSPTEAEFRDIFKIQQAFDEKYGQMTPGMTQEQMRLRTEEQKKINEQIKTSLGPERGADYERANDHSYRQAALLAERLNLPKTAATDVWNIQKDLEKRTQALFADNSGAPETRMAQRAALVAEANTKVTAALGERGAAIYKQNGGYWLQAPASRTTTPGATNTVIRIGP